MWVVVGLGNPGNEYRDTRHNIGFMVVDALAAKWNLDTTWRSRFDAQILEHKAAENIMLVKPQTYMNLSGAAVGAVARWYKVPVEKIIVIYDDMDIAVGRLRLRGKGSSGGHRGTESILVHLGKEEFMRVRVGIGRPPQGWKVVDYVLSKFRAEEAVAVREAIIKSGEAVETIIKSGLTKAMNNYNNA